jgi:uncharacterized protein YoxC
MQDIPAGWVTIILAILAALGTAVGALWRKGQKDIDTRDLTIKGLQDKVDGYQNATIAMLEKQLDTARRTAQSNVGLADSVRNQTDAIEKLVKP